MIFDMVRSNLYIVTVIQTNFLLTCDSTNNMAVKQLTHWQYDIIIYFDRCVEYCKYIRLQLICIGTLIYQSIIIFDMVWSNLYNVRVIQMNFLLTCNSTNNIAMKRLTRWHLGDLNVIMNDFLAYLSECLLRYIFGITLGRTSLGLTVDKSTFG